MIETAGKLECKLSDLTPLNSSNESADVQGAVLGASEDGSYVYFAAVGALAPGAEHESCNTNAAAALCNLYVWHDGTTKLVAVLSSRDSPDWGEASSSKVGRVSPNGEWLAFMSQRELTGYDNHDALSGKPDEEVYLYNANSGRLVCASCNPTGARPHGVEYGKGGAHAPGEPPGLNGGLAGGDRVWEASTWLAANIPGWTKYSGGSALYQSRYLSDSGRLFFNSSDALVPQDVNNGEDVYEYEPPGVPQGSTHQCTTESTTFSERSGGCVALISSGTSGEESAFLDASETGGDVFFLTTSQLSPLDTDTSVDIYDAQECTSESPCAPVAAVQPPPCETGDSCKAAPTPQPSIFGEPSSATFSGVGNVAAPPAVGVKAKAKPLTRAQKLAGALKVCRRDRKRAKRQACEKAAKKRYGPVKSKKKQKQKK